MYSILSLILFTSLPSCSFLVTPAALEVEEQIAIEIIKIIENELEDEFDNP